LPSEKNRGFQKLFEIIDKPSAVWSSDQASRKQALANLFGLRNDRLGEAAYICRRTMGLVANIALNRVQTFSVGI